MTNPQQQTNSILVRVIQDFTYKPPLDETQIAMYKHVETVFRRFRVSIENLIDDAAFNRLKMNDIFRQTTEYTAFLISLRETERWCNTAIANDYTAEDGDQADSQLIAYPGETPHIEQEDRVFVCNTISVACFSLITEMVQFLPNGRALSVGVTSMQNTRGWLLDLINRHWHDLTPLESYDASGDGGNTTEKEPVMAQREQENPMDTDLEGMYFNDKRVGRADAKVNPDES